MDGAPIDRLSRLVAQPSTRRAALGLAAALGISARQPASGKKRKNPCKGGCGPCRVCRKTRGKKRCVAAPDSAPCAGGRCRAGTCCAPTTCAALGTTCGTASDGCGGALACGACGFGATPACNGGTCATCAATCGAACTICYHRPDGSTACGIPVTADCTRTCTTDADCPPSVPFCSAAFTVRATNVTSSQPAVCGGLSVPGICSAFNPC